MENNMTFALIYESTVMNRFECDNYEKANIVARASHGDEAFAVCTDRYQTVMGDRYVNGTFYRLSHIEEDGTEVYKECEYIPTEKEEINELRDNLLNSNKALIESYEENVSLQDKLVMLQLLVTEMYEKMEG